MRPIEADQTILDAMRSLDRILAIDLLPLFHEAETDDAVHELNDAIASFYHLRLALSCMRSTWKDQAAIQQERSLY